MSLNEILDGGARREEELEGLREIFGHRGEEGRGIGNKERKRYMSIQVYKKKTVMVRIDAMLHHEVKLKAVKQRTTIKSLVEEGLSIVLADDAIRDSYGGGKK